VSVGDTASYGDAVRALALSLPEAYEDAPWGHPVFKVADNRMFAGMSAAPEGLLVTAKLAPEEREVAELLPYARRARYVGRYGWFTVTVTDEETLATALDWVRESYWLRAPARLRAAFEAEGNSATDRGGAARARGARRIRRSEAGRPQRRTPRPPP
jgi:predicted DNA-binding protein (MmcQ/YjbR family)